jgi:Cu/Zn superoxide dismutase
MKRGVLGVSLILALVALGSLVSSVAADQAVTVSIQPVNGSSVSGAATLTAQGNQTAVSLNIGGYPPNTSHPIHFHTGTCANPGPPVIPLPTMDANADGVATATAVVNVPISALRDGNHLVMTHTGPPPTIGTNIGCGDVPVVSAVANLPRSGGVPLAADGAMIGVGALAVGLGVALRRRSRV